MHVGIGGFPVSNVVVVGRRKRRKLRKGETPIPTCTSKESPIKSEGERTFRYSCEEHIQTHIRRIDTRLRLLFNFLRLSERNQHVRTEV